MLREEKREMRSLNEDFVKNAFVSANFFLWDETWGGGGAKGKLKYNKEKMVGLKIITWLEGERHMCNLKLERQKCIGGRPWW